MTDFDLEIIKRDFPTLQSDRLVLRKIVDADLEDIFSGLSNRNVVTYYGISYESLEATKTQMDWFANPQQFWWAICSRDTTTFYGAGGLNNISTEHKKAEIGLWLLPDFWGQGIMREAMPLICKYGFEQLGLNRIEGFVDTRNLNCKKAMAKLHFQHEGTMRDCEIKDHECISVAIYAQLKANI